MRCDKCGGRRSAYSRGTALIIAACAVCGAAPVMTQGPTPPSVTVSIIEMPMSNPLAVYLPAQAGLASRADSDSPHDHREFDSDPIPAGEYSAGGGGSISHSPFTSVPGLAHPGRMTPGAV